MFLSFRVVQLINFVATTTLVKYFLLLFIAGFWSITVQTQTPSPLLAYKDSVAIPSFNGASWLMPVSETKKAVREESHPQIEFQRTSEDWRFYTAVVLVIFFGLAKTGFRKIYDQLVILMFRTTVRSRQIKEQLQHTTIPSLAFNLLFVVSASLLLMLAVMHYTRELQINYFLLWLLCAGGVGAVYLVKYCWLKLAGWIFHLRDAADTYLFFVFFLNKVLGIFLIPLIVLLLISSSQATEYLLIISYFLVGFIVLYRYYLAYGAAQKAIKASPFHFLLYLCAVEITPLLLIYKALFNFLAY